MLSESRNYSQAQKETFTKVQVGQTTPLMIQQQKRHMPYFLFFFRQGNQMKILYIHQLLHKRHLDSSMVTSSTTKLNRTTLSRKLTVPKRSLAFHNSSKSFLQDLSFNQEKASMKEYQLLAYTPSSFLLGERTSITFLNYDLKPMTRKSTFILFSHRCLLFLK